MNSESNLRVNLSHTWYPMPRITITEWPCISHKDLTQSSLIWLRRHTTLASPPSKIMNIPLPCARSIITRVIAIFPCTRSILRVISPDTECYPFKFGITNAIILMELSASYVAYDPSTPQGGRTTFPIHLWHLCISNFMNGEPPTPCHPHLCDQGLSQFLCLLKSLPPSYDGKEMGMSPL
jgi:hypothetical protein